jgi:hypothetical protein
MREKEVWMLSGQTSVVSRLYGDLGVAHLAVYLYVQAHGDPDQTLQALMEHLETVMVGMHKQQVRATLLGQDKQG